MDPVRSGEGSRPTMRLPWRQLLLISAYWFGISAIWGGYEQFGQKQLELMVGVESVGTVMSLLELMGGVIAILVVPTMGQISDFTISRWGRRKGYIITGATLDLVFLTGLALLAMPEPANSPCPGPAACAGGWTGEALGSPPMLVAYAACFLLLQFSSNFAQGPYQGYVPDLVPDRQVAVASGTMGVMRLIGQLFGAAVMLVGAANNQWGLPLIVIGLLEVVLAGLTFAFVREGGEALPRNGRSWRDIARETWGTDVLHERSFLAMVTVRLLVLMGIGIFVNISLLYVERSLGVRDPGERSLWQYGAIVMFAIGTATAPLPAAWVSDRTGRRPVIWAAIAIASTGIAILAVAPEPIWAMPGALILGIGAGAYLAVDWALMTEVIPLAASGRYMGLANIANSISGPVGLVIGGILMDALTRAGYLGLGPRAAIAVGLIAMLGAAIALLWVRPTRDPRDPREPPDREAAAPDPRGALA